MLRNQAAKGSSAREKACLHSGALKVQLRILLEERLSSEVPYVCDPENACLIAGVLKADWSMPLSLWICRAPSENIAELRPGTPLRTKEAKATGTGLLGRTEKLSKSCQHRASRRASPAPRHTPGRQPFRTIPRPCRSCA